MPTHTDDREKLEPGAGITSAAAPPLSAGIATDQFAGYSDYFGFDEDAVWEFPDGRQWIKIKKLTEGMRGKFMRNTRPDLTINQRSGDAKIPIDQAKERLELIMASVVDWHIVRKHPKTSALELVAFNRAVLGQWIEAANPALVADLEKFIRKSNPWMLTEMSAEEIRKQIAELEELLAVAEEKEAREAQFPSAG